MAREAQTAFYNWFVVIWIPNCKDELLKRISGPFETKLGAEDYLSLWKTENKRSKLKLRVVYCNVDPDDEWGL